MSADDQHKDHCQPGCSRGGSVGVPIECAFHFSEIKEQKTENKVHLHVSFIHNPCLHVSCTCTYPHVAGTTAFR